MSDLRELLSGGPPDLPAVTAALDALPGPARVAAVRALGRRQQAALFEAARGYRPITLLDLVPPGMAPLAEVVHHGKNSLPVFTCFAKVFCRGPSRSIQAAGEGPGQDQAEELWGYNRNSAFLTTTVGPGYFVAVPHQADEVLIDYLRTPAGRSPGWPEILPNSARLSRFVYYRTQDVLRGVSRHVTIGRATRGGRPMDNWFVLCRQDDAGA